MIQEAKDIRKEIVKTAREKKAEKDGDRDGAGERQRMRQRTGRWRQLREEEAGACLDRHLEREQGASTGRAGQARAAQGWAWPGVSGGAPGPWGVLIPF